MVADFVMIGVRICTYIASHTYSTDHTCLAIDPYTPQKLYIYIPDTIRVHPTPIGLDAGLAGR